jgi:hypothetical protein
MKFLNTGLRARKVIGHFSQIKSAQPPIVENIAYYFEGVLHLSDSRTLTHTFTHTHTHTHTCSHAHAVTHTNTRPHTHKQAQSRSYTRCCCTFTLTLTHTLSRSHNSIITHAHTHKGSVSSRVHELEVNKALRTDLAPTNNSIQRVP